MILLLDTAQPTAYLTLVLPDGAVTVDWEAGRTLARDLLGFLEDTLGANGAVLQDITGIGVMQGPGSFTGLRIGLAVCNTLADALQVPIVGAQGDQWREVAQQRLVQGDNDRIVLPFYGSDATITKPRK